MSFVFMVLFFVFVNRLRSLLKAGSIQGDAVASILLDDGRRVSFLLSPSLRLPVRAREIDLLFILRRSRGSVVFHGVLDAVDDLPLSRHLLGRLDR